MSTWTVEYKKEHDATYYQANKERLEAGKKKRIAETKAWFNEYKATLKCGHCPENDPACLDFHHTDPSEKDRAIARAIFDGWSRERIMFEAAKCIILCSNCHRKFHARLDAVAELVDAPKN